MAHPITWSTEERDFILANHEKMTAKEMAEWLDPESPNRQRVYNICKIHGIKAKKSSFFLSMTPPQQQPGYVPREKRVKKKKPLGFERPPAVYSNCSPMGIATEFRVL